MAGLFPIWRTAMASIHSRRTIRADPAGVPDLASMVLSSRPPAVANPIKAKQSEADNLRQRGGDRPPRPVI
jgi:hypothetical protein